MKDGWTTNGTRYPKSLTFGRHWKIKKKGKPNKKNWEKNGNLMAEIRPKVVPSGVVLVNENQHDGHLIDESSWSEMFGAPNEGLRYTPVHTQWMHLSCVCLTKHFVTADNFCVKKKPEAWNQTFRYLFSKLSHKKWGYSDTFFMWIKHNQFSNMHWPMQSSKPNLTGIR